MQNVVLNVQEIYESGGPMDKEIRLDFGANPDLDLGSIFPLFHH